MDAFDEDGLAVELQIDTTSVSAAVETLSTLSERFSRTLSGAFSDLVVKGKGFDVVLQSLAQRMSDLALNAALKPLETSLSAGLQGLFQQGFGGSSGLNVGGSGGSGGVIPFANGGVVAAPTAFPLGGGQIGLAGEAGPEAILPLQRGSDGWLGVATSGHGPSQPSIIVQISTPDIESFRRSEAQLAATFSRLVGSGQRGL